MASPPRQRLSQLLQRISTCQTDSESAYKLVMPNASHHLLAWGCRPIATRRKAGLRLRLSWTFRKARYLVGALIWGGCLVFGRAVAAEDPVEAQEFFEKRVRPVLADRCFRCHSRQSEKLKGGLMLDSREGVLKGGEGGPILSPGEPEKGRLILALRYENPDLQMPPQGKLKGAEIEAITAWVRMGAPWPGGATAPAVNFASGFDLERRRREHWSWQPIHAVQPPRVREPSWVATPFDRFILVNLEKAGLHPAPPADRRTLIRRLHFDLSGLPPSPEDVEMFVRSVSPTAYEDLVDRLLASPRFGERWGRHWLDLVRYAETLGHEFDYAIDNAWRYRDYVIRAFNADLPYPQFVKEHVAGDVLPAPRLNPEDQSNESIIGTGFFWLGQRVHSPVDARQDQAEVIDNQIDVMSKTFLGLTVACARCHDHKFDAIPTTDYYALYGVMEASRYAQRAVNPTADFRRRAEELAALKRQIRRVAAAELMAPMEQIPAYLLAADSIGSDAVDGQLLEGLDSEVLTNWSKALAGAQSAGGSHPFLAWGQFSSLLPGSSEAMGEFWRSRQSRSGTAQTSTGGDVEFANASGQGFDRWFRDGFGLEPEAAVGGALVIAETNGLLKIPAEPAVRTDLLSRRFEGVLRSPSFEIKFRYLHVRVAGRDSRVRVCMDNLTVIRDPIYGGLMRTLASDEAVWLTFDLNMWKDHRAYIELADLATADPSDDGKRNGWDQSSFFSISRVVFSDSAAAPVERERSSIGAYLGPQAPTSKRELAHRYRSAAQQALRAWESADLPLTDDQWAQVRFLAFLLEKNLVRFPANSILPPLLAKYRQVEASIPLPTHVLAMAEGDGNDERVFIRGNPRTLGEVVPRRFLTALPVGDGHRFAKGSGRLELARCMTDPANPLLARVMVNRVWSHLFGRGIVPTPDDFGVLGQRPTNPELLDWLAHWYQADGRWSTKGLIRLLVTSSTYRMSSRASDEVAEERDPDNLLLHRMPVRRLEGEVVRDAMLVMSGRLDLKMYGPSVPTCLTEFMEGSGRPASSGPLDGAGRRSVYLEVRRNFLSPMMRTFDTPIPFTTVGRRTVSTVPAQSLILMNDPFVHGQAELWARRLLETGGQASEEIIDRSFLMGFGRRATPPERSLALQFLRQQAAAYESLAPPVRGEERAWADLCHVEFNMKEFIFLD
jgi:hypothetical protein